MRLLELRAGRAAWSLSLQSDLGLAGFVARGGSHWGGFMTSLHDAYRSEGRFVGPGPTVDSDEGPVAVGSRAFESVLQGVLAPYGLSREAYGAIWFGDGPIDRWLQAGRILLQGPDVALGLNGDPSAPGAGPPTAVPAAMPWVERLRQEALADLERLGTSADGASELEARLLSLRADAAEVGGDLEVGLMAWVRERQDAETRLLLYRDRERELRRRVEELEKAEEEPVCETCGQALADRRDAVHRARSEEWESVVQDGRWWRRRRDQLEYKPDDLRSAESRLRELEAQVDDTSEALERSRVQFRELEMVRVRVRQLEALADLVGDEGRPDAASNPDADGPREQLAALRGRLDSAAASQLRDRVHSRVVALTGGRLIGGFPSLYADWSTGGRRGGGEISILELAARITLAELALSSGVALGSLVLPTGLDRINEEDLPRALAELGRLARKVGLILTKATEDVASGAPERFDILFRVDHAKGSPGIVRQRSGLGALYLGKAAGAA